MAGTAESRSTAAKRQLATPVPYVEYDEFVEIQIARTRDSLRTNEIITALTQLALLLVGYLLVVVILDQWIAERGLSPQIRLVLLLGLLAASGYLIVYRILWPLLRRIHPLYAARVIEQAESRFQGNLVNWIDLKEAGRSTESSAAVRAIEKRAAVGLDRMDVDNAVDRRPLMQAAYALLGVVVLSAMYVAFSPKDPFSSVHRALLPLSSTGVATETTISDITPGDVEVTARSQVTVEADLRGKAVERAQILLTTADRKFVDQAVEMRRIESGLPRFRGVLNGENGRGLLQDVEYRIVANDAQSETFRVRVIQPPSAQIDQLTYTYPGYMQLEPRQVPGPAVDAWEGTKVTFEGRTNLPVSQARLILTDTEQGTQGEEVSLRIEEGTRFSGSWTLGFRSDGTAPRFYHVAVKTTDGLIDPNPVRIPIDVRADQRPEVSLLFPTSDLEKPANAIIPLAITASDPDFQLRSLTLKSERNGAPLPDQPLFESDFPTRKLERTWDWDLGRLGLQPGERVQYWIEARDNRQPVANRTNTPRLSLLIQEPFESDRQAQQDLADARQQLADDLAASPPNPNPGEAGDPQEGEQSPTELTEARPQSDDPVGRGSEPGDDGDPQPKNPAEPAAGNDTDEQTEFQNQLERLLNREERQSDGSSRPATGDRPDSSGSEGADENPSADEPPGNRRESESQQTPPDNGSKSSSAKTARGGKSKPPAESAADASQDNSDAGAAGDSTQSPEQSGSPGPKAAEPKSTGTKPERATPKGSAGKQGSQQPKVDDGTPAEQNQTADETPSATEQSPQDRRPTESQRKREDRTGPASQSATEDDPSREKSATDETGEGDETAAPESQERNPGGRETKQGPKASAGANQNGKPESDQQANRNASSPEGNDTSADERPTEDGAQSPSSNQEKADPSGAGQQPKSSEPPAGQRPPRPGQEPQSRSKPERPDPSANRDAEDSDDQQSSGEGESQQSDESSQNPGKSKNSAGQQQSGTKGGMKSNPGDSDTNQSSPPGSQNQPGSRSQQSSQRKQSGGSKTGQPQGSGDKPPAQSESSSDEGTGEESGTSPSESDEQEAADTGDTPRDPQGKQSASKSGTPKSKTAAGPRSASSQGESSPSEEESAPRGKQPDESLEHDDPPSDREESVKGSPSPNKRPNNPAEVGNQASKGQGRPQGQQSQQPSAGENGNSSASDQGNSGGNQEGAGESTNEPGESQPTGQRTGQSKKGQGTGRKGSGTTQTDKGDSGSESSRPSASGNQQGSRPGEGQSGSEAGSESGEGEGSQGEAGDSSNSADSESGQEGGAPGPAKGKSGGEGAPSGSGQGESGPNSKSGQPKPGSSGKQAGGSSSGSQPSQGGEPSGTPSASSGQSGAGRMGASSSRSKPPADGAAPPQGRGIPEAGAEGQGAAGSGDSGSGDPPASDEQKLDQLKEASNLILQKLKGQLSRGEVDEETLQDLGWKDLGQLRKFVSRLEEGLDDSKDDLSPEAQARRRQFEEILKSLRLDDQTETRARGTGTERRVDQVDAGRRPVPSSLRDRYEAYTRSLSKPGSSGKGTGKPNPPPPPSGKSR